MQTNALTAFFFISTTNQALIVVLIFMQFERSNIMQAISSYNAKLMHDTGVPATPTWVQLLPVKTTPQIGGAREVLPTTTLDDDMDTGINGIQASEPMNFVANYDDTKYDELKLLENKTEKYAVWFGNDGLGTAGKYKFDGQLSVFINETAVNGVVEMTVNIVPSTPVVKDVA
jgi:hypothetical protein